MADDRLVRAARNNATWCDTVCAAHGHRGTFHQALWFNRRPVPPFYPNVVTLAGAGGTADHLAGIRALQDALGSRAWSVKDSFGTLDLVPLGFEHLFKAT